MDIVTAAQMRAIEQAAMESGSVTGLELMERAGRGVVEALFATWPELAVAPGSAIVLCGPGNNGGDGFVIARLLAEAGWRVDAYLHGDQEKLPQDARANLERWRAYGGVGAIAAIDLSALAGSQPVLIVDALFGTGMKRPLDDALSGLAETLEPYDPAYDNTYLVAVDTPSGIDSDSGKVIGNVAFTADLTVTFGWQKPAHFLDVGPTYCGAVCVAPLGISESLVATALSEPSGPDNPFGLRGLPTRVVGPTDVAHKRDGHKYSHGHVVVLAGGVGKGGAARLAARGALRIGAGAVTVGAPPSAMMENAMQLNAIMLARVSGAAEWTELTGKRRNTCAVIGPGLGVGGVTRDMVCASLAEGGDHAVVLDADALTSFEDDPAQLFARLRGRSAVLTPHMGEFGRLFPDLKDALTAPADTGPACSRLDVVRDAAARAGCVVLLKGPDTVVAAMSGQAAIVSACRERACPWLATAGAGDVLAGFIAGLMARGLDPFQAATEGAWLHQECARSFGPGLIAEDLPEELPKVLSSLK